MQKEITLVESGRGLQLSTSRITVHDLVPYFQNGCSDDEIIQGQVHYLTQLIQVEAWANFWALYDYLRRIDDVRGTGRLYLP